MSSIHKSNESIDYFTPPKVSDHELFFQFHPQQTTKNPIIQIFFCVKLVKIDFRLHIMRKKIFYIVQYIWHLESLLIAMFSSLECQIGGIFIPVCSCMKRVSCIGIVLKHFFLRASKTDIKSLLTFNQISTHREQT